MNDDPMVQMAVGALIVGGIGLLPLMWKAWAIRRAELARVRAQFDVALARARASFSDAMTEVMALEEQDPDVGAEARLRVAMYAKKVEAIQNDARADQRTMRHAMVRDRLEKIAHELEQFSGELKQARPKKKLLILNND